MNKTTGQSVELVMKLRELVGDLDCVEVVVAPPFTAIHHLKFLLADTPIKLAAQNLSTENSGAYTGEISAEMLSDIDCEYVIIGHSERRQYFCETDELVNKKILAALRSELKPIVCVGESLEQKEAGKTRQVVTRQIKGALTGFGPGMIKELVIAYEPIWAIGTGKNATPDEAQEVHGAIKELLFDEFGTGPGNNVRIIYGGSVKPDNIDELMTQPAIDGALVGGASLKAEDFSRIIHFGKPGA